MEKLPVENWEEQHPPKLNLEQKISIGSINKHTDSLISDKFEKLLYLTTFLVFINKNTPVIHESELLQAREYESEMTPEVLHSVLSHHEIPKRKVANATSFSRRPVHTR